MRHGAAPESARLRLRDDAHLRPASPTRTAIRRKPRIGAGAALRGAMRMFFTYRGALFWRMRAGMGDIVFAPLYEVLERRGVRFEFFHRVEALAPGADGTRVASITLSRQATVKRPDARLPAARRRRAGCPAGPTEPLVTSSSTRALEREDAESFWSSGERGAESTLRVGERLRPVVLAIRSGAIPASAASSWTQRRAGARWSTTSGRSPRRPSRCGCATTRTARLEAPGATAAATSSRSTPGPTCATSSPASAGPTTPARSIAYFCSALPTRRGRRRATRAACLRRAGAEVAATRCVPHRRHGGLWPRAFDAPRRNSAGNCSCGDAGGAASAQRFDTSSGPRTSTPPIATCSPSPARRSTGSPRRQERQREPLLRRRLDPTAGSNAGASSRP